jgi:hypothetical protein
MMFAKGPMPGATPKQDALKMLPAGTHCQRMTGMGITGFVVSLPDGKQIASAGTAGQAWRKAQEWAYRHQPSPDTD